jgi:hypothetical protein
LERTSPTHCFTQENPQEEIKGMGFNLLSQERECAGIQTSNADVRGNPTDYKRLQKGVVGSNENLQNGLSELQESN